MENNNLINNIDIALKQINISKLEDVFNIPDYIGINEYKTNYPAMLFDQGEGKMCVPCAIALLRYIQNYKRCGDYVNIPDPLYIYGSAYKNDEKGIRYIDCIEVLKNGCNIINRKGLEEFNTKYNIYDHNQAKEYVNQLEDINKDYFKIENYYYIHNSNEMKFAITNFGAVNGMIPIYKSFTKNSFSKGNCYIRQYDDNVEEMQYYHMVTFIGWTNKHWIIQNSWGERWGIHGIAYIPLDYLIKEAWTCVDKRLLQIV